VPKTERTGRIHTSTISVAILPKPEEIKIEMQPKDVKFEACRSQGPGGQHVSIGCTSERKSKTLK
jgi:peptide chain release factor 1